MLPSNMLVKLEGERCQDFVFMLAGEKRIYKCSDSGREITLYEIGSGDICVLNASCILSNTKLPANAATMSETEVLLIPAHHFLNMIAIYEEMRTFVHTRINESMTSIMTLIAEITFGKMDERLIDYLIEKSENKRLKRTHQQIACDLGTAREVVSRLLKNFERQDLVLCSRNLIQLKGLCVNL
jgi:CRP/FNR family transcriptional regulator, anaerobic regulatory protein